MPDTLGWRKLFGIMTPSVNTVVQPEMDAMRPPGVTNHLARMHVDDHPLNNAQEMNSSLALIDRSMEDAVTRVMTANPDYLILGVSAESVWGGGGLESPQKIVERIWQRAGRKIGVSQATDAFPMALKAFGVKRKVALLTPYQPAADPHLRTYFSALGYEIVRANHMAISGIAKIANTSEDHLRRVLTELNGDDVEAIVQFGANLPMMRVAAEGERWLGKPVIAVNVAVYWHALRTNKIDDRLYGMGRLLAEH